MGKFCKIGQRLFGFIEPGTEHLEVVPHAGIQFKFDLDTRLFRFFFKTTSIIQQNFLGTYLNMNRWQAG